MIWSILKMRHLNLVSFVKPLRSESKWKRILIQLRYCFRARVAQIRITPSFALYSQNTYFRTHDLVNIKDRHLKHVSFETPLRGESKWKRILIHLRDCFRARDAQITSISEFCLKFTKYLLSDSWSGQY